MALLDAALAFALTLAALATVVTIVVEILNKLRGLRPKDQVKLMGRLYDQVIAPRLDPTLRGHVDRWEFIRKVLENPAATRKMAQSETEQRFLGRKCSEIYSDISLEHFLRRMLDTNGVTDALAPPAGDEGDDKREEELKKKLGEISDKYNEHVSGVSATYKCRAQFTSLLVGIGLALLMNVDGVRLFEAYLKDSELTAKVIRELSPKVEEGKKPPAESSSIPAGAKKTLEKAAADMEKARGELQVTLKELKEVKSTLNAVTLYILKLAPKLESEPSDAGGGMPALILEQLAKVEASLATREAELIEHLAMADRCIKGEKRCMYEPVTTAYADVKSRKETELANVHRLKKAIELQILLAKLTMAQFDVILVAPPGTGSPPANAGNAAAVAKAISALEKIGQGQIKTLTGAEKAIAAIRKLLAEMEKGAAKRSKTSPKAPQVKADIQIRAEKADASTERIAAALEKIAAALDKFAQAETDMQTQRSGGQATKTGNTDKPKNPNKPNKPKTEAEKELDKKIEELDTQLKNLASLGLPIGNAYFPHCRVLGLEPPKGLDTTCSKKRPPDAATLAVEGIAWFVKVIVTGLLIGLGAPFWYDVAKRLAQVRGAFRGGGSTEERNRGDDPPQNAANRTRLIDRIAGDAATRAA